MNMFLNLPKMVWAHEGLQATDPAQSTCFVVLEHVLGVYVDNVPCTTPPFAVFRERCLSLQPWKQKMTNGRNVDTLGLWLR